ncbi:MAG: hypothetical protein D6741_09925, partial [Planctomycetota bacterium]
MSILCVAWLMVSLPPGSAGSRLLAADKISVEANYSIVLTQVPVTDDEAAVGSLDWDRARLVLLLPGKRPQVLVPDFSAACDPDVSFDGKRILFAGKRSSKDSWDIFEFNTTTRQVRRITRDPGDCRHPVYQSTFFTIDSPEPVYQFTFVRSAESDNSTSLYSARLDGTHLRRLTYNLASDRDPITCRDGRIVYSAVQMRTLAEMHHPHSILMGINADGTDPARVCAESGATWKGMPCESGGLLWFVENNVDRRDHAGWLACVEQRRPLHTYR